MGRFLVIEEGSPLPRWLARHIGTYLPPAVREESLCGADGSHLVYHELSSLRARRKVTARLREAQTAGVVCGIICGDDLRQTMQAALDTPLADGRLLCASLRLTQLAEEADCSRRITLLGADSVLGQAAAAYLARNVRYLAVDGKRKSLLDRLAKRLWQTEGIAVRVGCSEGDMLVSIDELSILSDCAAADGRRISAVAAECALIAGANVLRGDGTITARTLIRTAEAARLCGIALLPKKGVRTGKFD